MNTQDIKTLGMSLDGWDYKKTNDPRIFDGYHVEGLTSKQYLYKSDATISMGIFYLHGKELYRAWGFQSDPCCSYHVINKNGEYLEVQSGCAITQIEQTDTVTGLFSLSYGGDTIVHEIKFLHQKQTFFVQGLTCNNCVHHVEQILTGDSKLTDVHVSLESKVLSFESIEQIDTAYLNALLKDTKYKIIQIHTAKNATLPDIKKFMPLGIMFVIVLIFTIAHQYILSFHTHVFMQYFMAGYFLLFGGLKVINWKKFVPSYRAYDLFAQKSAVYAWLYPALEFGLGVIYYVGLASAVVHLFVFLLMLQKAHSVFVKIKSGNTVQCACLGGFFNIPITRVTLAEDMLMALMALWMLL